MRDRWILFSSFNYLKRFAFSRSLAEVIKASDA